MAIDISKLNETQLTALMAKIRARLNDLQLEKVARVRDKVIAMITSEGLDYAELMEHTTFARRKKGGKIAPLTAIPLTTRRRGPAAVVSLAGSKRR